MTTREFHAEYIYDLCVKALEGLGNHMHNRWRIQCREAWGQLVPVPLTRWEKFWTKFWEGDEPRFFDGTFDEFCEARKNWLNYFCETLWQRHVDIFDKVATDLEKIKMLAEANAKAGVDIRVDAPDYKKLTSYAKVELNHDL